MTPPIARAALLGVAYPGHQLPCGHDAARGVDNKQVIVRDMPVGGQRPDGYRCVLGGEFVVAASEILQEREPGDDDLSGAVGPQTHGS